MNVAIEPLYGYFWAIAVDETIKFEKVSRAIQSVCFAY